MTSESEMTDQPAPVLSAANYLDQLAAEIHRHTESADWATEAAQPIYRGYAVLALAKGLEVSTEDVHNAWAAHAATAWPAHPSLVPYDQLSPEVRALDTPYMLAIREVAATLMLGPPAPVLSAADQIDHLAKWIMANVPGEPSQSEGAVDTAIRLLAAHAAVVGELESAYQRCARAGVAVVKAQAELAETQQRYDLVYAQWAETQAEVTRLRGAAEALARYGRHYSSCLPSRNRHCTCGLDAARQALGDGETP